MTVAWFVFTSTLCVFILHITIQYIYSFESIVILIPNKELKKNAFKYRHKLKQNLLWH
jgi:hypothetical protein